MPSAPSRTVLGAIDNAAAIARRRENNPATAARLDDRIAKRKNAREEAQAGVEHVERAAAARAAALGALRSITLTLESVRAAVLAIHCPHGQQRQSSIDAVARVVHISNFQDVAKLLFEPLLVDLHSVPAFCIPAAAGQNSSHLYVRQAPLSGAALDTFEPQLLSDTPAERQHVDCLCTALSAAASSGTAGSSPFLKYGGTTHRDAPAAALLRAEEDEKGSSRRVQQWSKVLQFDVFELAGVDDGAATLMDWRASRCAQVRSLRSLPCMAVINRSPWQECEAVLISILGGSGGSVTANNAPGGFHYVFAPPPALAASVRSMTPFRQAAPSLSCSSEMTPHAILKRARGLLLQHQHLLPGSLVIINDASFAHLLEAAEGPASGGIIIGADITLEALQDSRVSYFSDAAGPGPRLGRDIYDSLQARSGRSLKNAVSIDVWSLSNRGKELNLFYAVLLAQFLRAAGFGSGSGSGSGSSSPRIKVDGADAFAFLAVLPQLLQAACSLLGDVSLEELLGAPLTASQAQLLMSAGPDLCRGELEDAQASFRRGFLEKVGWQQLSQPGLGTEINLLVSIHTGSVKYQPQLAEVRANLFYFLALDFFYNPAPLDGPLADPAPLVAQLQQLHRAVDGSLVAGRHAKMSKEEHSTRNSEKTKRATEEALKKDPDMPFKTYLLQGNRVATPSGMLTGSPEHRRWYESRPAGINLMRSANVFGNHTPRPTRRR
jgi:hypothetical protein